MVHVNGVELCVQTFGDPGDPSILLVGNTMLTWPDGVCGRLAASGRHVVRYDLRDTGRSTTHDPDAPEYTLRDLVADAAGLIDVLGLGRTNVVGFATGGFIAQLLALDHPGRVSTLTLIATRPTAPGPADPDLPEHSADVMAHVMGAPQPDWSDRASVVAYMVGMKRLFAGSEGIDEADVAREVGRIYDRAIEGEKAQRANQMATVFAALDCGERWRERLGEIAVPTLVIHGEEDPFFPVGNARALAAEIPGAELLILPKTGQELPRRHWDVLCETLVRHTR
ncbi:alpha/beta fold hydrolase [Spirillospora sp. CA-294931]|uniref:alpha/beta fold hydrolase n=1 Tax=Spirillospora sp. CA-294931 TaxID=3240042 RepID=UPI003D8C5ABB